MNIDLETLVPHRGRMKLLDEIIEVDEHSAVTQAVATNQWPLVENGAVSPLVIIELVAQTSAVCIGWKELKEKGEGELGGRGWLVGIKDASFKTGPIPVDTKIITKIGINFTMDGYTEIQGESEADNKILGQIVLQVLKDNSGGNSD